MTRFLLALLFLAACHRVVTRCERAGGERVFRDCHPQRSCLPLPAWASVAGRADECPLVCNVLCFGASASFYPGHRVVKDPDQ